MVHQARRDLHDMTATLFLHFSNHELRHVEEASEIDAQNGSVVGIRVLSERLGDENASVVDKRIDAAKPPHCLCNDTLGRSPLANVTAYCDDAIVCRRRYRSGGGDHTVAAISI